MKLKLFGAAAFALAAPASAATPFDFEAVPTGAYTGSLIVTDAGVTLTVTPEGDPAGFVFVDDSGVPLFRKGVNGSNTDPRAINHFAPLRFSFNQTIDQITFNFGDNGGDDDSPVNISAFDAFGSLLGTATAPYGAFVRSGNSLTLAFAGTSDFVASSGSGFNNNSIFYDISSFTLGASAVPEPATWAMMIGGFGMVGGAMRRTRRKQKVSVSYA